MKDAAGANPQPERFVGGKEVRMFPGTFGA